MAIIMIIWLYMVVYCYTWLCTIMHGYCTWLYTGMHGSILFYSNTHHFSVSYSFSDFVKMF